MKSLVAPDNSFDHAAARPADADALRAMLETRLRRDLPGGSSAARSLREQVLAAVAHGSPVLLLDASGCGAQGVARCLHDYGRNVAARFESLCCAADSSQTLQARLVTCGLLAGCVEEIDPAWHAGGTLFLRRVDALALPLQKVLADALARRSQRDQPAWRTNVRLILAIEADPHALLAKGALRRDLHDAVAPCALSLPRLRDRREDVGEIARRLLEERAALGASSVVELSDEALRLLERHDWPGDVGELRQAIDSAAATESSTILSADAVAPWIERGESGGRANGEADPVLSFPTLREMERRLIEAAFAMCDGNRERTARCLGIGIRTLSGKLREYGYPPRGGPGSNGAVQPLRRAG